MEERIYDLIFICRPGHAGGRDQQDYSHDRALRREHGGKIEKTERWGTRRLAYRVAKHREGFFVYMVIRRARRATSSRNLSGA